MALEVNSLEVASGEVTASSREVDEVVHPPIGAKATLLGQVEAVAGQQLPKIVQSGSIS